MVQRSYRVLMFTAAFAPFANPEAIVNSKLALAFLDAGWEIDVISRNLSNVSGYNYGSKWVEPWLPLMEITHEATYEVGGKIYRLSETIRDALRLRHPLVGCRWAAHALELALRLHDQKSYQVILSRSLPDVGHLPALAMAKIHNLPWVANWNDATGPKNPPPVGQGAHARLGFFHSRFLHEVAQKASWLTFPSDRMRHHICQYLGNKTEEKNSTIPHIALYPSEKKQRNKNEIFTICYAGNLYSVRNPEVFFLGLAELIKRKGLQSQLRFTLIGLEDVGLTKLVKHFGLESNIQMTGPLSYKDTLNYLEKSDVLLVIEAPYEEGIYLPSKFVDYVQTGRPILAISPKYGTLNDIISSHGGGIAVDCRSSTAITEVLDELFMHWSKNTLDEVYGSGRLYNLFSPQTVIDCYEKIFRHIGVLPLQTNKSVIKSGV